MGLVIEPHDPSAPEVVALLEAHLALMRATSPPGHVHALDIEGLTQPDITFFAARSDDRILGVGAVRYLGAGHGEIKSMHTAEAARGMGIGRALVEHLIALASERGWQRLSLETGTMDTFAPAHRLYESMGFRQCEPFGDYTVNQYSLCMTLDLTRTVG
ncbi:MAG: GNAT family N-acetyltransferase [Acidimicrobiales bacterium]